MTSPTSAPSQNPRRGARPAWRRWGCLVLAFGLGAALPARAQTPWHLGSAAFAGFKLQDASPTPDIAPAAINTGGLNPGPHPVVVAVIDSGVIADHPSLAGRLLPGYDMQSPPANIRQGRSANFAPDPLGTRCEDRAASGAYRTHGTEVASLIAGNGKDGVRGVNPQARVVPIRLVGACGMSRQDLVDAIAWAGGLPVQGVPTNANPARVINLSLAGGAANCSPALQNVITQLNAKGVILVAAAGNSFHRPLFEPANCAGVISVGSVDAQNRIEVYSALDSRTTLYAPGGGKRLETSQPWGVNKLRVATYDLDLWGRERANALDRGVGTSYAAPVVSGFIALWLSYRPQLTAAEVASQLPQFLRDVEPHVKCPGCSPKSLAVLSNLIKP